MNKNIISKRAGVITVCIISICLLIVSSSHQRFRKHLSEVCGYMPLVVLSDSMYPTIEAGDLLLIRNIGEEMPEIGDIIAFYDASADARMIITHRIVDVIYAEDGEVSYITQGDGNNSSDRDAVHPENIIGRMSMRIGGAGRVIWTIRDMLPWIFTAAAMAVVACAALGRRSGEEYEDT